jgi:methionine-rich copper-binding protein CopC
MTTRDALLRSVAVAAALAIALVLPATAMAHAELEETSPADGVTVEGTPSEISATFSEALVAEGSSLSFRAVGGEDLAEGGLDPDDPARLLIADVPDLAPGEYEVRWTVATDDGHVERDTWSFTVVAAPTPSPSPTPAPTASAAPTAEPSVAATPTPSPTASPAPSASAGPDEEPAASTTDVLLPIVAVLGIVVVGVGIVLSRRNRAA